MQTVWTADVEVAAAANMRRCQEMLHCKAQISKWKDRLKQLQAEHRQHAQYAELRRNPTHWNRLKKNVKFRPECVKIALLSSCYDGRGGGGNTEEEAAARHYGRGDGGYMIKVPALLQDWKLVPTSIRGDPELFLLRLRAVDPPVDYFPLELAGHRAVVEEVIRTRRLALLLNGTSFAPSTAPLWSDRGYYKLLLLHNDVSVGDGNRCFRRFHFAVRNDADLILSIHQMTDTYEDDDREGEDRPQRKKKSKEKSYKEDFWQRLLNPCTGCFDHREPNTLLWKNRKDVALHILRQSENCLRYFTARLRDDPDVVAVALATHGGQLPHASTRLRKKPKLIAIAFASFPASILYALKRAGTVARLTASDLERVFETAHELGMSPHIPTQCYKFWKELPLSMRNDRNVAMAAYRHILPFLPADQAFAPPFAKDRSFWTDLIETTAIVRPMSKYNPVRTDIIYDIPFTVKWAFALIPTMLTSTDEIKQWQCTAPLGVAASTDFWLMVARSPDHLMYNAYGEDLVPTFVYRNKLVMVEACRHNHGMLEALEDSPLAVDRDILMAAIAANPLMALMSMKDTAQLLHPDLVADALGQIPPFELWSVFHQIDEDVWIHRDVALAWVQNGGEYLEDEFQEEFEDDPDIFLAIAEHSPQDFWHASVELCGDKDYMMEVVQLNAALLREASSNLLHDFDLNLLAFGSGPELPGVYDVNNPDDFDFLTSFATQVRERLLLHRSFFTFLLGMEFHGDDDDYDDNDDWSDWNDDDATKKKKKKKNVLTTLSRDAETSMGLKKNIASFLAVPRGEDLRLLRCASLHLSQWGF